MIEGLIILYKTLIVGIKGCGFVVMLGSEFLSKQQQNLFDFAYFTACLIWNGYELIHNLEFGSSNHGSCYFGVWILLVELNYSEGLRLILKHTLHSLGLK